MLLKSCQSPAIRAAVQPPMTEDLRFTGIDQRTIGQGGVSNHKSVPQFGQHLGELLRCSRYLHAHR